MTSSLADSAKPYLDYLDKEMTIQGILSAFCVAVGAAAFDRILGVRGEKASALVLNLQTNSRGFVLSAIVAVMIAALCFYLQRSKLAWLHGLISLAIMREMQDLSTPSDSFSFKDGLNIADSWSLWNMYKVGLAFLAVTAVEVLFALFYDRQSLAHERLIFTAPYIAAAVYAFCLYHLMRRRDA